MQDPFILQGNKSVDSRGNVSYVNKLDFSDIKRFYLIENADTSIIRGFHGHMKEGKYFFPITGRTLVCYVQIDDPKNPSKKQKVESTILTNEHPQILYIPSGYANGMKSLDKNAKILVFSTSSLEESLADDFRFPHDYWGEDSWKLHENA